MGFDIYGISASGQKGEYFRNSVWWWRPLWDYVCDVCRDILTKKDKDAGHYNDGHRIDSHKAAQIAERLLVLLRIRNGEFLDQT